MNRSEVSGLLCVGMHGTDGGEESYAAEYPNTDQNTPHITTTFDVVMAPSAMYTDHINTNACLDDYHTSGIQPMGETRFGSAQPLLQSEGMVADSEEESMPSSPDTLSTGVMEQNLQHIYNAYDAMVDNEGPVVLSPAFIICDKISHLEPHLTFSSDGIKIEYLDLYSSKDEKMITLQWEISNIISISCKWIQSVGSAFVTILVGFEAETGNEGSVRVQFCLDDEQWPRRRQKIWELGPRYQEIWEDIPLDDFTSENWSIEPSLFFPRQYFSSTDDFEDVIFPQGDPDAVSISKRDVELLLPETFVNDTIIDFYIKYLSTRIESTEKHRYHFFNSFFFRKLADLDKDQGRAPEGRAAFLRVRKWTRKINIFEKDFLFIPVNFNLHWSLIVICYPGEVTTFEDDDTQHSARIPCILHMDSLKGNHAGLKDIIQSYLWEEWKERHPESASDNSDKFLNLRFVSLELPQQDNTFDCGLFLLHYVEQFLTDAPSNLNPLKIDAFSGFLSDDWFAPAEASLKRSVVRKLIDEVVTGSYENHPKLACAGEQLDERHQRCSNAEWESTGDFLGQKCSAGEPETVRAVLDCIHEIQPSKSICLNDPEEKRLPASGCMLDTGRVSIVDVQNQQEPEWQACSPDKDTGVCLSSHDEKNELLLAESSAPEDDEVYVGSNCVVTNKEHGEPLFVSLDHSQNIPSQEVGVGDIMVSTSCSISEIAAQEIACKEHSFQRSAEAEDVCFGPSQDTGSVMMLDSSKDDDRPIPERMTAEGDCGDPHEDMDSVMLGDIDKDIADTKCSDSLVDPITAINATIENVKEGSLVDPVTAENAIIENVKEISTPDPVTVENAIIENVKDIGATEDNVNCSELYVSSQLPGETDNGMTGDGSQLEIGNTESKEESVDKVVTGDCTHESGITAEDSSELIAGNTDKGTSGGSIFSSNVNEGSTNQITSGDCTNETDVNGDGDGADKYLATNDDAVPFEDDTTCTAVVTGDGSELEIGNTESKEESIDKVVTGDCTHESGITAVDSSELIAGNTDKGTSGGSIFSSNVNEGNTNQITSGDCTNETDVNGDGDGADKYLATNDAVPFEDDTTCTAIVTLSPDAPCSTKNETVSEDTSSEAKRPLHGGTSELLDRSCRPKSETSENTSCEGKRPARDDTFEENDIAVSGDKCIQKDDGQGTEAKVERHYKRRKVLALERQQSFLGETSLH